MGGEYLKLRNWPGCIDDWGDKTHDDPSGVDNYPSSHPKAGSVGTHYLGDVCPFCGVPLSWREVIRLSNGDEGELRELVDIKETDKTPYHPKCWRYREGELSADITEF